MSIKPDRWIRRMCVEHGMIEPFVEKQVREGVVSYGISSYGYDIRVADEFKIFTNVLATVVDPKNVDPASMVDFRGPVCIVPPNSFALARTVEYFRIPRNVLTLCVGKCVSGETQVFDPSSGRPARIDSLEAGSRVPALRAESLRSAEVSETSSQGTRPVYEVVTRTGRTIRATSNHPFLTFNGWRTLADLSYGARIGVPRRVSIPGSRELRLCEVELLGLMISDGQCPTPGSSPRYTSGDPVLRSRFCEALAEFGCTGKPVGPIGVNPTNRGSRGGIMERNRMTVWLESLGLNVRSTERPIPAVVYELVRPQLAHFLRALFSGDGGISISGASIHLEYCSTSEALARGVQHLLLRFGIVTILRSRISASGRTAYVLCVTSKDQICRFAREIGFLPGCGKQARLDLALEKIDLEPQLKSNFDTLPPEAWQLVRASCRNRGLSMAKAGIDGTNPAQSVSRGLVTDLAHRLGDESLAGVADSDVLWDTIVAVRYAGMEPVFDLTVPEAHNFVANDFIVHNSTYARCGIITNVTPFEPEWEGHVTLEISNTTPLPAKIYANEGIAQVLFFESDEPCETSYRDRAGKYQKQKGITLPRL